MTGFTTFNFGVIAGGGSVRAVVGPAPVGPAPLIIPVNYLVVGGGGGAGSGRCNCIVAWNSGGGGAGGFITGIVNLSKGSTYTIKVGNGGAGGVGTFNGGASGGNTSKIGRAHV